MKYAMILCMVLASLVGTSTAQAQRATERFIPIGRSPGLSGVYTRIGTIETVNTVESHFTLSEPSGITRVRITDETHIWLDASAGGSTNRVGAVADLQEGRRIEVKFKDNDPGSTAEWIKVEILE